MKKILIKLICNSYLQFHQFFLKTKLHISDLCNTGHSALTLSHMKEEFSVQIIRLKFNFGDINQFSWIGHFQGNRITVVRMTKQSLSLYVS